MAKSKFNGFLSDEEEKEEYDRWVAGTHQKRVPLAELHEHPDNWELVGRIDEKKKGSLKEDISRSGIREPLQVWYREGKLVVVSGHERLNIARELGLKELPCIKVDFETDTEVKQHIFATNKHRKEVKLPPPELMKVLFPPEEYPLMYADLRGNYAYEKPENGSESTSGTITTPDRTGKEKSESESTAGTITSPNRTGKEKSGSESTSGAITPEQRARAKEKRQEERRIQTELRKKAEEVTGYSEKFTARTVKEAARDIREAKKKEKPPEKRELTTMEEKKMEMMKKKLEISRAQRAKREQQMEKIKSELADLKKNEKRLIRELAKFGVEIES